MSDNDAFKRGFEAALIRASEIARIHQEAASENFREHATILADPSISAEKKTKLGTMTSMTKFAAKSATAKAIKGGIEGLWQTMGSPTPEQSETAKAKELPPSLQRFVRPR